MSKIKLTNSQWEWVWLGVAFLALFGVFYFQALAEQGTDWWAVPSVFCLLVSLFCCANWEHP